MVFVSLMGLLFLHVKGIPATCLLLRIIREVVDRLWVLWKLIHLPHRSIRIIKITILRQVKLLSHDMLKSIEDEKLWMIVEFQKVENQTMLKDEIRALLI